jgi:hypothetical protein
VAGLGALVTLVTLAALLVSSAARAETSVEAVDALIHDISKVVEIQSSLGWKIDKYEYEEMMPDALLSVCRSTDEARLAALGRLDDRITGLDGPLEEAYRRSGDSLDGLSELVFVTRVRTLLEEASRRASTECPLGMKPEADFRGLQTDAYRFTLSVEGGGLFTLQKPINAPIELGGGGSGRMLLGRGLNQHWTVLAGAELGLTAIFDQTETATNFPIQFTAAVPVVVRHHRVSWHFDFELAPLGFFTANDRNVSMGGRFGFLLGVSTLRVRRIMPWAGIGFALEYIAKTEDRRAIALAKGGARVGFDWDF